ncbi:hypothetical protein CON64_18615 [Bacillus pseudomycoides]|nr:hypothetical protein CON64_18615 [Bacillus pseudomycoides]
MATITNNRNKKKQELNTGDFIRMRWGGLGTQYYIVGSLPQGGCIPINLSTGSRYGSGFKNTQDLLEDIEVYEGVYEFEIIPSEAATITFN